MKRPLVVAAAALVLLAGAGVYTQVEATGLIEDQAALNVARADQVAVPYGPALEAKSATLAAFYGSARFDPFVDAFVEVDQPTGAVAEQNDAQCEQARDRVFLEPWTGRVERACEAIERAQEDVNRAAAFASVEAAFDIVCTEQTPDAWTTPFDETQWIALDRLVVEAVAADCG